MSQKLLSELHSFTRYPQVIANRMVGSVDRDDEAKAKQVYLGYFTNIIVGYSVDEQYVLRGFRRL